MLAILFNAFTYLFFGIIAFRSFTNLRPFLFVVLFYLAPLIINIFYSVIYIRKDRLVWGKTISPIFSTIAYVSLGIIVQNNGLWEIFTEKYTCSADGVSISIASSMIELSQIIFIALLYFGINYLLTETLEKKGAKNEYVKNK